MCPAFATAQKWISTADAFDAQPDVQDAPWYSAAETVDDGG